MPAYLCCQTTDVFNLANAHPLFYPYDLAKVSLSKLESIGVLKRREFCCHHWASKVTRDLIECRTHLVADVVTANWTVANSPGRCRMIYEEAAELAATETLDEDFATDDELIEDAVWTASSQYPTIAPSLILGLRGGMIHDYVEQAFAEQLSGNAWLSSWCAKRADSLKTE